MGVGGECRWVEGWSMGSGKWVVPACDFDAHKDDGKEGGCDEGAPGLSVAGLLLCKLLFGATLGVGSVSSLDGGGRGRSKGGCRGAMRVGMRMNECDVRIGSTSSSSSCVVFCSFCSGLCLKQRVHSTRSRRPVPIPSVLAVQQRLCLAHQSPLPTQLPTTRAENPREMIKSQRFLIQGVDVD